MALILIAVLLSIKFIFVPLVEWQDKQIVQLRLLDKKVGKIEQLIYQQEKLELAHREAEQSLVVLSSSFYTAQNPDAFKRKIQKQVEEELEKFELKISNIGWQTTVKNQGAPIDEFGLEYSFSGKGEQVFQYMLYLAQDTKYSDFSEFSMSFSRQKPGKLGRITIRLIRTFYMKATELESSLSLIAAQQETKVQLEKVGG